MSNRDAYRAGLYGSKTYGGSGGTSNKSFQAGQQSRKESQQNKNTGQSDKGAQQNKRTGNEKAADQLARLQNKGQGNSAQARSITDRLARVDAKAEQFHADGRKMSYAEKLDLAYGGKIPGHLQRNMQDQVQNYQDNPPKLEPKEITLADGTKMMTYGSFEPGQFSQNQYKDVLKYGIKPTDPNQWDKFAGRDWMDFGFGSVFGDSSGSTASSPAVQQSLEAMMQDLYDQGYSQAAASQIAMDKMYPGYLDYAQGKGDIPVNFMDMNVGAPLPGHQMTMDTWRPEGGRDGGYSGGDGGWGSGWGGYGDGGGGGGYGYASGEDPMERTYQRAQVGPGTLQEQVNQIYLGMSGVGNPGFQKNRGGIVSLVE